MPNIEFHGFPYQKSSAMKGPIDELMKKTGLQDEAVTSMPRYQGPNVQINGNIVETCDGKKQEQPFIRLWSTNVVDIMKILSAFQGDPTFHLDVEALTALAPNGLFYFPAADIKSGQWRGKFNIKNTTSLRNIEFIASELSNLKADKHVKGILEYFDYQFLHFETTDLPQDMSKHWAYNEHLAEMKVLVELLILGRNDAFVIHPHESDPKKVRILIQRYGDSKK